MRTLITGARSGLGKYLSEQIESDTLNRSDELPDIGEQYDLIIHCANNGNHYTWGDVEYNFYRDNIFISTPHHARASTCARRRGRRSFCLFDFQHV